jgi:hypothetical protein
MALNSFNKPLLHNKEFNLALDTNISFDQSTDTIFIEIKKIVHELYHKAHANIFYIRGNRVMLPFFYYDHKPPRAEIAMVDDPKGLKQAAHMWIIENFGTIKRFNEKIQVRFEQ